MKWELHRLIHLTELAWIGAWLLAGIGAIAGMNLTFLTRAGERNLWEIIFAFLL